MHSARAGTPFCAEGYDAVSHDNHAHDFECFETVFKALTQSLIAAGILASYGTQLLPTSTNPHAEAAQEEDHLSWDPVR